VPDDFSAVAKVPLKFALKDTMIMLVPMSSCGGLHVWPISAVLPRLISRNF